MARYNPVTAAYGRKYEIEIQPVIETLLGEELTKTKKLYDIMDFTSASFDVELKTRGLHYRPESFRTWLLPKCKGDHAETHPNKTTVFFYYFPGVDRLFFMFYEREVFERYEVGIPVNNLYDQPHYFSNCEDWTEIIFEYE